MTDLEQYEQPAAPAPLGPPPAPVLTGGAMSMIREYTAAMDDAHRFASAICRSSFVPEHFRGKPEETALAILYGATVGFDPMTSAQQIFVIGGRPALYARAMVAVVVAAGHEIWTDEEGPGHVTVAGRRKGSDKVARVTWTSELAQQAGYTKNPKYRSDPRSMLYARASGDVARRVAPDALLGLAFNVEEMQLVPPAEVQRSAPARSTARDQVAAAIAAPATQEPPAEPVDEPTPEPDTDKITSAQTKKLHATYTEAGITDRKDRLAYATKVLGRDVPSSKDLTKDEAHQVIESLIADLEARQPVGPVATDGLDARRDEILKAAEAKGATLWDVESAFSSQNDGILFYDGTPEQLDTFAQWVAAQPNKAA